MSAAFTLIRPTVCCQVAGSISIYFDLFPRLLLKCKKCYFSILQYIFSHNKSQSSCFPTLRWILYSQWHLILTAWLIAWEGKTKSSYITVCHAAAVKFNFKPSCETLVGNSRFTLATISSCHADAYTASHAMPGEQACHTWWTDVSLFMWCISWETLCNVTMPAWWTDVSLFMWYISWEALCNVTMIHWWSLARCPDLINSCIRSTAIRKCELSM